MSKLPSLPVYAFTVYTGRSEDSSWTKSVDITAAYFQESESGVYTLFKDADHSVVEAYKTESVRRIVRTEQPVDRR